MNLRVFYLTRRGISDGYVVCAFPSYCILPKTTGKKRFQTPEETLRRLPTSCHLLEFLQALIKVIDSRPRIVLLAAASNATVVRE